LCGDRVSRPKSRARTAPISAPSTPALRRFSRGESYYACGLTGVTSRQRLWNIATALAPQLREKSWRVRIDVIPAEGLVAMGLKQIGCQVQQRPWVTLVTSFV